MERNLFLRALAWLGRHELGTLLAIGGLAAGVWFFAALADEVMEGGTRKFDSALARDITALGGPTLLMLLTAAVSLFLALDGKKHMALYVCCSVGSGLLVSNLLKDTFDRPRPDIVPHVVYASSYSFPSGHSMLSAITYLTLGAILARSHERRLLKAYFLLIAVFLTLLIGVTRVYLGVHWPTDVLAGWTAGAVWALLCWLLARWLQGRHTLETEAEHRPPASGH